MRLIGHHGVACRRSMPGWLDVMDCPRLWNLENLVHFCRRCRDIDVACFGGQTCILFQLPRRCFFDFPGRMQAPYLSQFEACDWLLSDQILVLVGGPIDLTNHWQHSKSALTSWLLSKYRVTVSLTRGTEGLIVQCLDWRELSETAMWLWVKTIWL